MGGCCTLSERLSHIEISVALHVHLYVCDEEIRQIYRGNLALPIYPHNSRRANYKQWKICALV